MRQGTPQFEGLMLEAACLLLLFAIAGISYLTGAGIIELVIGFVILMLGIQVSRKKIPWGNMVQKIIEYVIDKKGKK